MFALMKQANWTDAQLRAYLISHYQKSHWNLLIAKERRAVIAMLQYYVKKQSQATNDHKEKPHGKETH